MSFILKSVELKNIRTHEYFLFEPALTGITSISGETGAGKSTIVDAFAWSLYGTRPSGVKNKNLIKDGIDPKDKPVSVKSTIILGGIEYIIERKIISKTGTTECNVWAKNPKDGSIKQVAGPSVTHVEKFLKTEIGMNEKGFLTSILIQQKQVDQIVSATPRERGLVIEELTGIASVTKSIQMVNEETRGLEKAASIFKIGSLEENEEKVNLQKKNVSEIEEKAKSALEIFKKAKETLAKEVEEFRIQKAAYEKKERLTVEKESSSKQITFLKEQAERDMEYIQEYKEKNGGTLVISLAETKKNLEEKRSNLYLAKNAISSLQKEVSTLELDLESCVTLKGLFSNSEEVQKELEIKRVELEELEKKLSELVMSNGVLTAEITHSKASLEHLDGEHKDCPVCKSPIDDAEQLKEDINNELEEFKVKLKEGKKQHKETVSKINEIKETIKSISVSFEAIKQELVISKNLQDKQKELEKAENGLELISTDFKFAEKEHDNAVILDTEKKNLESAKARSLTVYNKINEQEDVKKKIDAQIKELNALSERSFNALKNRVEELKEKVNRMSVAGQELMGRRNLALERLEFYENDLQTVKDSLERYNQLAKEIEVSALASNELQEFKGERIDSSIPKLEFYASDFLSKFSNGEFVKLTLDEKFNTFVTTNKGVVRPVSQLSGGELSSSAIALRLGIAMLVNATDKNVLILDEVLVSMDESRAQQIMEAISSMTNSQVIFIAHNPEVNTIADKTVLIEPSKTKGEN